MSRVTELTKQARGRSCQFQIAGVCQGRTETCVWVHSDSLADGKGMGIKAHDEAGAIGCFECHHWLHTSHAPRVEKQFAFKVAQARTRRLLDSLKEFET